MYIVVGGEDTVTSWNFFKKKFDSKALLVQANYHWCFVIYKIT